MATPYDTDKMLKELADAGVKLDVKDDCYGEETYNEIIHQYNLTFCPVSGYYNPEVGEILYSLRNYRNQKWMDKFIPGRY